jgi:hypothetical protein
MYLVAFWSGGCSILSIIESGRIGPGETCQYRYMKWTIRAS